ncbi:MAG: hypothetical protein LH679_19760 [Cyanobacteria bacterium CAN_BIN43]|nr:hypothetical protein [Cyanobacteria bacterium CAN_BIN43]
MHLIIIINSIVCVLGIAMGLLFAGGSIISIANMTVPWRDWLLGAALLVPVAFVIGGIGAWQADIRDATQLTLGFVAFPWLYVAVFVLVMLVSFE